MKLYELPKLEDTFVPVVAATAVNTWRKLFPVKSFCKMSSEIKPIETDFQPHNVSFCVLSVLINTYVHSYTVQWLTVHTTWITCLRKSLWLMCLNGTYCAAIQMCPFKVLCVLKQKDICSLKKERKHNYSAKQQQQIYYNIIISSIIIIFNVFYGSYKIKCKW